MRAARARILIASGGGFLGLYLELSVVPYIAAHEGGRFAAGILTFSLMITTVAMQAVIPILLRRFTARGLFGAGLILIGAPTMLYGISRSPANLIAVTLVRGAGFGLLTVMGAALMAAYSPPASRGSSLGAYGVASSMWAAFAPALGLALTRAWAPLWAFTPGTLAPLLGAAALLAPLPHARIHAPRPDTRATAAERVALVLPVIVFTSIAAALAAAFTFMPLLHVGSTSLLLVLFGVSFTTGRVLAGQLIDRGRSPIVLVLRLLAGVVICLTMVGFSNTVVVTLGAVGSGLGIGCLCTTTLVMMLNRSGDDGVARASVVWNIAYDAGQAAGAIALGAVAALLQPSDAFLAAAALIALVAYPAAAVDRRRSRLGAAAAG